MYLTRHPTPAGPRWALDRTLLPESLTLALLLELPRARLVELLQLLPRGGPAPDPLLPPADPLHEIWASGVTYRRSREARRAESDVGDVYEKVYDAVRPELFLKAPAWRAMGHAAPIRVRRDSPWNVPEPELVLVVNRFREIVGYCAGNDVSSRAIEGENPLYLPQAKIYDGACALGPGILIAEPAELAALPIRLEILRAGALLFEDQTSVAQMKRSLDELVSYLYQELSFPHGAFLMTGTGIVPPDDFTLQPSDTVRITVGSLTLENEVR